MGFRKELEGDSVSSLPLRDAIVVEPQTLIDDAVKLMRAKSLGCAVIVDDNGVPTGIFTEQSLLGVLAEKGSLRECAVGDHRDPGFLVVKSSDPIWRVWSSIESEGTRFVCVIDGDGKLIGVTGQRGIAEYLAEYFPQQILVQRLGSTPWMQQREGA